MAKIKFDAQEQAILITNFENGTDAVLTRAKQLDSLVSSLEGYQSKHKAQLLEKIEEVRANLKKAMAVVEAERDVVKAKREYLIQSEATNPFANIQVEANTTSVADVC